MQLLPGGEASCEVFDFSLPRLEEGALRTLDIQVSAQQHAQHGTACGPPQGWSPALCCSCCSMLLCCHHVCSHVLLLSSS
jgi:hypothetical protein